MKYFTNNWYVELLSFSSYRESTNFLENQPQEIVKVLNEPLYEHYYCFVYRHSLSKQKEALLLFSSDDKQDAIIAPFQFGEKYQVVTTGKEIFLISGGNVDQTLKIETPIIGYFILQNSTLLILEETGIKIIDQQGKLLKADTFELIEDFRLENNVLFLQTELNTQTVLLF